MNDDEGASYSGFSSVLSPTLLFGEEMIGHQSYNIQQTYTHIG